MNAIASFDRWVTQRTAASLPHSDQQLRQLLALDESDWLGLLADESQCRGRGFSWRLALWRAGREPQWLSPPLHARAGESASQLRRQAVREALRLLLERRRPA